MFSYSILEKNFRGWPPYLFNQAKKEIFSGRLGNWESLKYLPKEIRERLKKNCSLAIKAKIAHSKKENSQKATLRLDGRAVVESVLMRHGSGRNTVCLSSQAGCPMACAFCATGRDGFQRNLTADEIIAQALFFQRVLEKENEKVSNIVFMGMGEPLLNYNEAMKAIDIFNSKDCFNIAARKISISTCGIVPGIKKLSSESKQINLALSLHAANDELRNRLMPVNSRYPLGDVLKEIKAYINQAGRQVMIEYILLSGINDSENDARQLAGLLKKSLKSLFFVNLIVYNPTGSFQPSSKTAVGKFKAVLTEEKITFSERFRFGRSAKAACGQLAGRLKK